MHYFPCSLLHTRKDVIFKVTFAEIEHQWASLRRHNGRDCVSNHQPHDCLLNRLFGRSFKKTAKVRVTGLCAGNSEVTDGDVIMFMHVL